MKFVRKEEAQKSGSSKMAEGIQTAEIINAKEATAKSGNPLLILTLRNSTGFCDTRLVLIEKAAWKIIQALEAVGKVIGIGDEFEATPEDFIGETVTVEIKNNENDWPDVVRFLPRTQAAGKKAASTALEADEIPF